MMIAMILFGALVGLAISEAWLLTSVFGDNGWLGLLFGGLIGALWARLLDISRRLEHLERQLQPSAGSRDSNTVLSDGPRQPASQPAPGQSTALSDPPASDREQTEKSAATAPASTPRTQSAATAAARTPSVGIESATSLDQSTPDSSPGAAASSGATSASTSWLWRGNVPVRIGVLVSLVGIAALLRYAAEQGWLTVPIEARLALVAGGAVAGLVFGWRQRFVRRAFALSVQGGAVGVLLLVIFAAYRLYAVIPLELGFFLSIVLVAGTGLLAVRQDARWLAVLAMLAGFAAPLVIGEGQQGPTGLFAWYTVLNIGVFAVAWWKRWPLLNRIGFSFTFIIGSLWGYLAWLPQHYESAQFFLLLFCALYFSIPIFEARRSQRENKERFDALIVFSLPLVALPLQAAMTHDDEISIAAAAFMASLVYLFSAVLLIRRWQCPDLGRAHAVLAIALATLAVPFAFSGSTVTLIWALQGAALVWFGCQQSSRLARLSGLLLQLAAGVLWLVILALSSGRSGWLAFNPELFGALALAVSGLISARAYERAAANMVRIGLLAGWGVLFWALGGIDEVQRLLDDANLAAGLIGFWALTSLLTTTVYRWRPWPVIGFIPGLAMVFSALLLPEQMALGGPLAGWGAAAWLAVLAAIIYADLYLKADRGDWRAWHSLAAHGSFFAMLATSLVHLSAVRLALGAGWSWLAGAVPLVILALWLLRRDDAPLSRRPLATTTQDSLLALAAGVIVVGLLASLFEAGNARPLPWLVLFNPLELTQWAGLLVLMFAAKAQRPRLLPTHIGLVLSMAFLVVTAMALRAIHQVVGTEWDFLDLFSDARAQAALTLTWTTIGTLAWVLGSRRGHHGLWLSGALLLGFVLLKLLIIDRSYLSTVAGIVSFMAFGALSITIGYLAPAPPRQATFKETEKPST